MRVADLLAVIGAFEAQRVRYLLVGGLAVIAHGYIRATMDIDLVLDMRTDNLQRALAELERLGYRPRVPVPLIDFMDAEKRQSWQRDKDMLAFTVIKGSGLGQSEIDLFLEAPFPFDSAWSDALVQRHPDGVSLRFVDLRRLLRMKEQAGRPKDLLDITELRTIHGDVDA